jgi:hypothetical protein
MLLNMMAPGVVVVKATTIWVVVTVLPTESSLTVTEPVDAAAGVSVDIGGCVLGSDRKRARAEEVVMTIRWRGTTALAVVVVNVAVPAPLPPCFNERLLAVCYS